MKRLIVFTVAASGLTTLALPAVAGDDSPSDPNRLSISYRPGFNISAKFSGLGGFAALTSPGPATGGGINRTYDDGSNLLDIRGNAAGLTWNWSYSGAAGQVPGNDTIMMHSYSSPAGAVSDNRGGDPQHGFEFTYNRRLGTVGKCPWGVEVAFNYTDVTIRDGANLSAPVTVISDAFALNGVTPPLPPGPGTFAGPGTLIGDSPTRTTGAIANGAAIAGNRALDTSVYGWRLGPYLDVPVGDCTLSFSAGLAVAYVDSSFAFSERVTIPAAGTVSRVGSASADDVLWGGYLSGTFSVPVSSQVRLAAGVQFQDVGTFSQMASGKKAELDLGQSIFVMVGVGYSF